MLPVGSGVEWVVLAEDGWLVLAGASWLAGAWEGAHGGPWNHLVSQPLGAPLPWGPQELEELLVLVQAG